MAWWEEAVVYQIYPRSFQDSDGDGVPIATVEAKQIQFLIEMTAAEQWQARNALLRRRIPPKVRAYLNQSGSTTSPTTISRLTH